MGTARLLLLVATALAAACPAGAAVLYKSVGPNGTIMFSDVPPTGDARIVEQRVVPDAAGGSSGAPWSSLPRPANGAEQMLGFDQTVAQANQDLDLAEHALALARRGIWSPVEGVRLNHLQRTPSDEDRLEFYKKRVAAARKYLLDLLKERPQLAWSTP